MNSSMQRDVYHYFQQACRRTTQAGVHPKRYVQLDEAEAGFMIRLGASGCIDEVEYRCTTCVTLVALCEHVAENLRGVGLDRARELTAADILRLHPEIPYSRHSRAELATAAVHAAIDTLPI
jgi:NifU-like protein